LRVDESLTVPQASPLFPGFADMPPVFATAFMVGFTEWICIEAVRPYLDGYEHTVGIATNMTHVAATPPGMNAPAGVEVIDVAPRVVKIEVTYLDDDA